MRSLYLAVPDKQPISRTDPRFLSIALDWALIVGERWWEGTRRTRRGFGSVRARKLDLNDPRLISAAAALGPAYLRLGGSESDRMAFDAPAVPGNRALGHLPSLSQCPTILSPDRWDEVVTFAGAAALDLFVCVGVGACARDQRGRWEPHSFRRFLDHLERRGQRVAVWELGNEVNGFPFIHGLSARVSPAQYAEDFGLFRRVLEKQDPENGNSAKSEELPLRAGPASAVWPVIGEPIPMAGKVARRLRSGLDMLTWHYYPYQSRRGVIGVRRVGFRNALRSRARRSAQRLAGRMRRCAATNGIGSVWLSETGQALFGGEPGISDRFAGSLWWLDHLGTMARAGMNGVVRQALVGGDYGLLEQEGLRPRPDFWCSLLWKSLMGTVVYDPLELGGSLRVYRQSRADGEKGWSALAVNMSRRREVELELEGAAQIWRVEGSLDGRELEVNGSTLGPEVEPSKKAIPGSESVAGKVSLPPASAAFLLFGE